MITQRPKGTQDWFGHNMELRSEIERIGRELAAEYNMKEIITPVFEHTVLFARGVGETTDVVQKEMYTFNDKGDRSITLKPEGTAGAIRAYIENSLYAEPAPAKLFYVTPAFRYEQPQSGRLRQHHQFGVEMIGSRSPLCEIELISFLNAFITRLGLKRVRLHINSIGCPECRKTYNAALLKYLSGYENDLCGTCRERMKKNPLRVIDCKVPSCREIVKNAPRTVDYLCGDCSQHFEELKSLLNKLQIPYEVDTGIVRGLDYYTKTVFEFVSEDGFTLCGGGRYDGLVHEIEEKQDIPAVGFGCGIERIIYFLEKEGVELTEDSKPYIYIGLLGNDTKAEGYSLVRKLRESGIPTETDYMDRSAKAQMKYANKLGVRYVVMLGSNELESGIVKLKDMTDGSEKETGIEELPDILKLMLTSL